MKKPLVAVVALLLSVATPAFAHQVDEYVQATTISVGKDRVQIQMRMTPGVDVFAIVLGAIDADHDGAISAAERRAYAERVLHDVSLTIDGQRLALRPIALQYSSTDDMRDGRGSIQLAFAADIPSGGPTRRVVFENHHLTRIAAYLANGIVPRDPDIRITAQKRNYEQSIFELDYAQSGVAPASPSLSWSSRTLGMAGGAALLLFAPFALTRRRARPA
jgi:hypothetical protein